MTARFSDRERFAFPVEHIRAAAVDALATVHADDIEWSADGTQVSGRLGVSIWSWGERVSVTVGPAGQVTVSSRCAFPLQAIDWGKNESNCRAVMGELSRCLAAGVPAVAA